MGLHQRKRSLRVVSSRSRMRRGLVGLVAACAVLFGVVPSAWASVGLSVSSSLHSPLTVGQRSVAMLLNIRNVSTGAEASQNIALGLITLVPSCGALVLNDCPAAAEDPGVLRPGPVGVGQAGTACAGVPFSLSVIDSAQGKYQLTPNKPQVLGPVASATHTCAIRLTVDVARLPAKDASPSPGLQTAQLAEVRGMASDGASGTGSASTEVTINKLSPPTVTSVVPNAGSKAGGNRVTIQGAHFVSGSTVKFGTTAATQVVFVSANKLTAKAPAHAAGSVDVRVHTRAGTSAVSGGDRYTYR